MFFPILGAHISVSKFTYPDLIWKEVCGQMANLITKSGGNKGQLSLLVEAIYRNFPMDWASKGVRSSKGKPEVVQAYGFGRPIGSLSLLTNV